MKKNWLAVSLAILLFASTGFAQSGWFTIKSGLPQTNDIFFTSTDVGYIVGYDGFARKSTDGGLTWLPMKIESNYKGKVNFLSVSFPTSLIGYISGNEVSGFGIILKTTDAGNTWNKTSYSLPYFINYKIIFPSATVGYITTEFTIDHSNFTYMLLKTTDGGNVWQTLDSSAFNVSIEQMVWKTENLGLLLSHHLGDPPESYLQYTSDGGKTFRWAGTYATIDKTTVGSGEGNVWYCGIDYVLSRSEDTNFHWMSTNGTPVDVEYGSFFIPNGPDSYSVTTRYPGVKIFKTTDNGLNWFAQFKDTSLSPIAGYAPSSQIAFLVASYDSLTIKKWRILKTIDGGGPALSQVQQYVNNNISLSPNPTTGIITVHNTSANILHVTINNIIGESVLELEHQNAPEFALDLSKLPQGTYFARFMMAGESIVKKIIKE